MGDRVRESPPGASAAPACHAVDSESHAVGAAGHALPERLGGHRVCALLGRGGGGVVYEAEPIGGGARIALKLLPAQTATARPGAEAAHRREFLQLQQLKHPRLIAVHAYGRDPAGVFYTMELLRGAELRASVPLPWRRACEVLRDVALSLSIIHGRRLLHRDVSPGNVRLDGEGRAKLIDFGAVTTFGVPPSIVGTPHAIAPEALRGQGLDGRTDLYGLGTLGYWLLCGRHAYSVRRIAELPAAWRSQPLWPSEQGIELPASLEALLRGLLAQYVGARPVSAAEVINRLEAIAALRPLPRTEVAAGGVVAPALVGRGGELDLLEQRLAEAHAGRGCSLLVEGPPGVGRSRLLGEASLVAARRGLRVVQGPHYDRRDGGYAALAGLIQAAVDTDPELLTVMTPGQRRALTFAAGGSLAVGGRADDGGGLAVTRGEVGPVELADAVAGWLETLCQAAPTALLVDDFHLWDAPSATVLVDALRGRPRGALCVLFTCALSVPVVAAQAVQRLRREAERVRLLRLGPEDTAALVQSVFGPVPNAKVVAGWADRLGEGNPRRVVALLQHLVDGGIIDYRGGSWQVPARFPLEVLPGTVQETLLARVARLSPPAAHLLQAICLAGRPASDAHLRSLSAMGPHGLDEAGLLGALQELLAQQLVRDLGGRYRSEHPELASLVIGQLDGDARARLHALHGHAFVAAFEHRPGDDTADLAAQHGWSVAGYHLLCGGQLAAGFDIARAVARHVTRHGHTPIWEGNEWYVDANQRAIQAARELGRPPEQSARIRGSLLQCAIHVRYELIEDAPALLELLADLAGITHWYTLADIDNPGQRIRAALQRAYADHAARPPARQELDPIEAVREFVGAIVAAASICAHTMDTAYLRQLSERMAPLLHLSKGTRVMAQLVSAARARTEGRVEEEYALRIAVLAGFEDAEVAAGMNPSALAHLRGFTLYSVAVVEAQRTPARGLARAQQMLEQAPFMAFEAWQVRALAHIYQGNLPEAHACWERMELSTVTGGATKYQLHVAGWQHLAEACALAGDLVGMQHVVSRIGEVASGIERWRVFHDAALSHYARLRGDTRGALEHAQRAASGVRAGEHRGWLFAQESLLHARLARGEYAAVVKEAARLLSQATAARLGPEAECRLRALSGRGLGALGETDAAFAELSAGLDRASGAGMEGLLVGHLHEQAARVAVRAGDPFPFAHHALQSAGVYCQYDAPSLIARQRELLGEASQRGFRVEPALAALCARSHHCESSLRLMRCTAASPAETPQPLLQCTLAACGAEAGHLYRYVDGDLRVVASAAAPASDADALLPYLQRQLLEEEAPRGGMFTTETVAAAAVCRLAADEAYRTVLLRRLEQGKLETIGALALRGPDLQRMPSWEYLLTLASSLRAWPGRADGSAPGASPGAPGVGTARC